MITPDELKQKRERLLKTGLAGFYRQEVLQILGEVERLREQVELSHTHPLIARDIYNALGWQGGTIHQVVAEIKRLRESLADYIQMAENQAPVFNAAVAYQEICSEKGKTHHETEQAVGYLYDRVRRYKQHQEKKEESKC